MATRAGVDYLQVSRNGATVSIAVIVAPLPGPDDRVEVLSGLVDGLVDQFGGAGVADERVQSGGDRRRPLGVAAGPLDVGLDPGDALLGEHPADVGQQRPRLQQGVGLRVLD